MISPLDRNIFVMPTVVGLRSRPGQQNTQYCFVQEIGRIFVWVNGSTATDDGFNAIVPTALGGFLGAWVAVPMAGSSTVYQGPTTLYVDSVAGSDDNDGLTSGTALKTVTAVLESIGDQVIDTSTVTVNLSGSFPGNLSIKIRVANGGGLAFEGTQTSVLAGTINVANAWNYASGVIGSYSLTGLPSMAAHVGQQIQVTSGAHQNYVAVIAADLGSGVFRANWADPSTGSPAEPAVADPVSIYTLTKIGGSVDIDVLGDGYLYFQNCDVGAVGSDHSVALRTGWMQIYGSIMRGFDVRSGGFVEMSLGATYEFRCYGEAEIWSNVHFTAAGGDALSARSGGLVTVYGPTLVQGYGVTVGHPLEGRGTLIISDPGDGGGPLVVADYAVDAFSVLPGSQLIANDHFWAYHAATGGLNGYRCWSGGGIYYISGYVPAVYSTAPATFALIGGTAKTSVQVPYVEPANGAAIVVLQ